MKRLQLFALVSALTVMGLASCQPVETAPEKQETGKGHSVIFNVQVEPEAATKTALRLQFIPDWRYTDTDDIHIFETASTDGVATQILKANQVDIFTEDNDQKAYFHAWFDDISVIINPSGVLTKASAPVYNYTSIMAATETEGDELRFVLPSTQYPTSTSSFDPKADFLIGQCATTYNDFIQPDQRLNLNFIRPVAIGRFAIVGLEGSSVQSVKVTFEQPIAGYTTYGKVDFEESTAEFTSDDSDKVLTLLYPEGRRKSTIFNAFFLALEGRKKAVSMEVRTDSYIFTKNYPNTTWTLNKDIFNEIVIDMSTATKTALLDQEMQFKDGEGAPVSEITYDLVENGGSVNAFVSPVFSRESACQTEVTFASNNEEVATVDADGNIALTGAAGVAVITASADGDATHKAGTASVTITVVTPEVTFYEAKGIDNDVEYLIVSNGKAVKYTATGMSFEDVTVSEGTITIDNSLLEGLLWKAAAIDATSEFATFGTHTFTCSGNKLMRESDGAGSMALAASDAAMSKYMAWNYDGAKFWNHSVNGENINDFCLTYDSADGWAFEYQSTPTTLLYTTLKPREIAFTTTAFTFDRYTDTDFTSPTIDGATYVSSDTDIAAVDPATGIVTLAGKTKTGTVTITATVAAGNGFQGASASYTIEVGDSDPGQMSKPILVYLEPATELVAGEEYYLVSNGMVLARDGANASAVEFDADKVAAVVDVDLVDNIAWTLAKQTGTITRGNEYVFTQGEYFFGIAMNTNQQTYTYTVEANVGREVSNNVTIQDHNISLTNNQIYYAGNSSNYYIFYNTTDNKWDNEKVSSSSTPAATSTTALYVAVDTRDEQTAQFVDAGSEPVTAVEFDLASGADFVAPTLDGTFYGDVTYSTDDTHGVITLNESTGAITINKKGGPVTITANIAGTTYYKPTTASYTLTVKNSSSTATVYTKVTSTSDLEVGNQYILVYEGGNKAFKPYITSGTFTKNTANALDVEINSGVIESEDDELEVCHLTLESGYFLKSDAEDMYLYPSKASGSSSSAILNAEATATNALTIGFTSAGIAEIKCGDYYLVWSTYSDYFSSNTAIEGDYQTGICLYMLDDGRQSQTISFSAEEAEYDVYASDWTVAVPTLSGAQTDVTYASSNENVATVDPATGDVTIVSGVKKGDKAVITATAAKTATYRAATASYTIHIISTDPSVTVYTKVVSNSDLDEDAQYILVYETASKAFNPILATSGSYFTKSTANAVDVEIVNDTISSNELEDCEITFESGEYLWIASANKYLYPGASGDSALGAEDKNDSHTVSISIASGIATIARSSDASYHLYWSSSNYFSGISSTSSSYAANICIYKREDNRQPQSISFVYDAAEYDVYTNEWTVDVPSLDVTEAYTNNFVFESLNEDVATVDDMGIVTIAAGAKNHDTAVIKATVLGDETYKKATATYTITIVDSAPLPTYVKAESVEDGEEYLIVSNGFALRNNSNSAAATDLTASFDGDVIKYAPESSELWTAAVASGKASFQNGSTYLARSSSNVQLSTSATSWSYDSDNDYLTTAGSSSTYYFYYSTGNSRFSCSTSVSSTHVATLYVLDNGQPKDRKLAFDPSAVSVNIYGKTLPYSFTGVPTLSGKTDGGVTYTVACSDNSIDASAYPTVSSTGEVTINGTGVFTITAAAEATAELQAGDASYTLTVTNVAATTYTKTTSVSTSGSYLIVSAEDDKLFNGVITTGSNAVNVTPVSGVITDTDNAYSAYEFTFEKDGDNYYIVFDGKYLVCNYTSGDSGTGLLYVSSKSDVTYPYTVSASNGAVFFNTTQANSASSTNQYLYYKSSNSGSGPLSFKIGGSGSSVGVHIYKKD